MINTANVTCRVTEQQCVACHNCNSPQFFQQCMQKPKEHLQLAVCLHSKAIESITTWKSHMCSLFGKFRMIHRFCCQKCCWSASSQVFDACSADVRSNSISCGLCCTEHQPLGIIWLCEIAVVFLVKTSRHFHVLLFFLACCELSWSASAAKHTHNR